MEQFGYPITEEYSEVSLTDGKTYTTQYFERARFENHPENKGTQYEVLQGLLGREMFKIPRRGIRGGSLTPRPPLHCFSAMERGSNAGPRAFRITPLLCPKQRRGAGGEVPQPSPGLFPANFRTFRNQTATASFYPSPVNDD